MRCSQSREHRYTVPVPLFFSFYISFFQYLISFIMQSSLIHRVIFVFSIIVFSAGQDFFNDDLFSVSDTLSTVDSPFLTSSDSELFLANAPGSSLWDPIDFDSNLNEPFQLADCSAAEDFSTIGKKALLRRRDGSKSCPNSATGVGTPPGDADDSADIDALAESLKIPLNSESTEMLMRATANLDENNFYCYVYSKGLYPAGVCSSGNPADIVLAMSLPTAALGSSLTFNVNHATLSMRETPDP